MHIILCLKILMFCEKCTKEMELTNKGFLGEKIHFKRKYYYLQKLKQVLDVFKKIRKKSLEKLFDFVSFLKKLLFRIQTFS